MVWLIRLLFFASAIFLISSGVRRLLLPTPPPHLTPDIIAQAAARYQEICETLTGEKV